MQQLSNTASVLTIPHLLKAQWATQNDHHQDLPYQFLVFESH